MDHVTAVKMLMPRQSSAGSHRNESNSLSSVISTLVPTFIISVIGFIAFIVLRKKLTRIYEPRSLETLVPQHHEAQRAKGTAFGWIPSMREVKDSDILKKHSMDGYLFLRFLKLMTVIAFVGACVTWPILFPVNATGGGGQEELDILSFSNVSNPNRYYAHTFIAWIFLGFVCFAITRERKHYIGLRQAYYLSPLHALRLSSRTIMFLTVPEDQLSTSQIKEVFSGARNVWMVPDCKDLEDLVKDRDKQWQKVEKAQVKVILDVFKKSQKEGFDSREPMKGIKQPTHRTKPLIGKKVETISFSKSEMTRMNQEIEKAQSRLLEGKDKMLSAAFVEFDNQLDAQKAYQFALRDNRRKWNPRHIGVQPDEIIWKNLGTSYTSRKIKMTIATVIITLMVIFWAVPVAFVGALTNINYLTEQVPFLSFINSIPHVILGVVTGLLPVVLLAVLMALVPVFCRLLAKFAGASTLTEVELKTQSWYFAFQVVQVFLVTTFSSGASSVAAQIVSQPASAVTLLAENLPKASNFYISYFILTGLMMAMMNLLSAVPLLLFYVLGKLDKTPRKQFNRWLSLQGLGWGSTYPKFTNLGVIAISYSCIAPLVLGFATIGFALMYIGFRYNFLFVYGMKVDMKGTSYCRALKQLVTGVYLATVCLIGLFAISVGKSASAVGPLVLMILFLVVLIVWQVLTDRALGPLEDSLPIYRLETNKYSNTSASTVEYADKDAPEGTPDDTELPPALTTGGPSQGFTGNAFTRWASPFVDRSFEKNKAMLDSWSETFEQPEQYSAEDVDVVYQHPALSAETKPLIWLPKDRQGMSEKFVKENREAGLESTDDHAWLNEKGKVEWGSDNIKECPIYEQDKIW